MYVCKLSIVIVPLTKLEFGIKV